MIKVALIQNIMVESLGYMYISAVLKEQGHAVEVFYCDTFNESSVLRDICDYGPDVAGFSVLTPHEPFVLQLAQKIKEKTSALTIFGNIHVLLTPQILDHQGVDMICLWEGEYVLRELCRRLDANESYQDILGLWVKTDQGVRMNEMPKTLVELDRLPFHDRSLYDKYRFFKYSPYLRVSLGRGCPGSCSFCHNAFLRRHYGGKQYIRKQTPQRAINELSYHLENRKRVRFIFFTDEVFWVDRLWLREFLHLYKRYVRLPFSANLHFLDIKEEDIRCLKEAGVFSVIFAAETGDERQRIDLLNKKVKNEQIFKIADWLHQYRIRFVSSVIFGLPGDTVQTHADRLNFYRRLRPAYLWTAFFQPYPKLPLTDIARAQGLLEPETHFAATVHHQICLKDVYQEQMENLKKVYFLCMRFPGLEKMFLYLTKFRIPLLFNFLFFCHFTYYIFQFEKISFFQFLVHVKVFKINPFFIKIKKIFYRNNWRKNE